MNLGTNEIKGIYVGSTPAAQMHVGTTKVWPEAEPEPVGDWLCFTAEEANSSVHLDKNGSPNTIYLETSTNGSTWTDYSWSGNTGDTLTLANVGDKLYMRAKTENQTIGSFTSNYYKFVMTGKIAASGNIQTLLKADGSRTDAPRFCYYNMFRGCASLSTAPALPATILAKNSYASMFRDCTSLTAAPALPAMTLASDCYYFMFAACSSLTTAPALPATTLADECYACMFLYCRSLASVDVSFTDWNLTTATNNWVSGVAASGTFTCPAALPDERGASKIPNGWTKVDAA